MIKQNVWLVSLALTFSRSYPDRVQENKSSVPKGEKESTIIFIEILIEFYFNDL